jgi:hypothetical protein
MSGLDIHNIPSFMRPTVDNAMRLEFGLGLDALQTGILNERLARRFLLFADNRPAAQGFVQKIQERLENWPSRIRFHLRTGPSGIEIRCPGLRVKNQQDIEPLVTLGEACLGR